MSEEFGGDIITLVDDEGNEAMLEVIDRMDYNGNSYALFLPADMEEEDPDYGFVILRSMFEDDIEVFDSIESDEELNDVYERFMRVAFGDDYEAEEHPEEQ